MPRGLHVDFNKPKAKDGVKKQFRKKQKWKKVRQARDNADGELVGAKKEIMRAMSTHHRKQLRSVGQVKISKKKLNKLEKARRYAEQDRTKKEQAVAHIKTMIAEKMDVEGPSKKPKKRKAAQMEVDSVDDESANATE